MFIIHLFFKFSGFVWMMLYMCNDTVLLLFWMVNKPECAILVASFWKTNQWNNQMLVLTQICVFFKDIVQPKMNSHIIYSVSCLSKPAWCYRVFINSSISTSLENAVRYGFKNILHEVKPECTRFHFTLRSMMKKKFLYLCVILLIYGDLYFVWLLKMHNSHLPLTGSTWHFHPINVLSGRRHYRGQQHKFCLLLFSSWLRDVWKLQWHGVILWMDSH